MKSRHIEMQHVTVTSRQEPTIKDLKQMAIQQGITKTSTTRETGNKHRKWNNIYTVLSQSC